MKVNSIKMNYSRPNFQQRLTPAKVSSGNLLKTTLAGLALLGASSVLPAQSNNEQKADTTYLENVAKANNKRNYNLSEEEIKESNKMGEAMQECLHGYTSKKDWEEFQGYVSKITPQNVMHVVAGFNAEGVGLIIDSDKFFEQLDTEYENEILVNDARKTILKNIKEYVTDNISTLDEQRQEKAKEILAVMDNSNAKILDEQVESLQSFFDIKDKNSWSADRQWYTILGLALLGAAIGYGYAKNNEYTKDDPESVTNISMLGSWGGTAAGILINWLQ